MTRLATPNDLFDALSREVRDSRVLEAIQRVPRDLFVPPALREAAWENRPLPIGNEQTISQPLIVALMTEALALKPTDRVLELGTGSGYQTAILARLAAEVVSVERFPSLQATAAEALAAAGVTNVRLEPAPADTLGYPGAAPYEGIIATAGAPEVPAALLEQLAEGGRLVIPVGSRIEQNLLLVTRRKDRVEQRNLGPCRFVPLVGPGAWPGGTDTRDDDLT